jgi:hypothetical protein
LSNIEIFKTIILPVVLCGCETWSLTFSEERTISAIENGVLRGIFVLKWNEVKRSGENYRHCTAKISLLRVRITLLPWNINKCYIIWICVFIEQKMYFEFLYNFCPKHCLLC